MTNKANIILDDELYCWLDEVRRRTDARSIPDVIRTMLTTIRNAAARHSDETNRIIGNLLYDLRLPEMENLRGFGIPPGERPGMDLHEV